MMAAADFAAVLADIAARATFLVERAAPGTRAAAATNAANHESVLADWLESCSAGDAGRFGERLRRLGLDPDSWHAVLPPRAHVGSLPEWASAVEVGLLEFATDTPSETDSAEGAPAFATLLAPFPRCCEQQLRKTAGSAVSWLAPSALRDLRSSLIETVSTLSCRTLVLELNVARLLKRLEGDSPRQRFDFFLRRMADGPQPMLSLFSEYPVLARLMGTAMLAWLASCRLLVERLEQDREMLARTFCDGLQLAQVESVTSSSDPHNGGQCVMILGFKGGLKLVYKPRDIRAEAMFQNLLMWLNERSSLLPLLTTRVLPREGYGYMEYVEHRHCEGREALRRFYHRAGMQLCLLYVMQATDFHYENIIACGEHPVLVDLESLFHPQFLRQTRPGLDSGADFLAAEMIEDSVIRTGMLPNARLGDKGLPGYDVSGLGGPPGQLYPRLVPVWQDSDTDQMRIDFEYAAMEAQANIPVKSNLVWPLPEFAGDVVAGFREMYGFLLRHRDEIKSSCPAFVAMATLPFRFIVRPTQTYFDVLSKSLDPQYLRDGLDYSICLEILWRVAREETIRNLVEEEIRQLHALDIPYFTIRPAEMTVEAAGGATIDGLIDVPSWNAALTRLERLSETDKERQTAIIQASFEIKWQTSSPGATASPSEALAEEEDEVDFLNLATQIADEIRGAAIRSADGTITWIGPEYIAAHDEYRLQPLSPTLYGGKAGIAVFLAAVYELTDAPAFREDALRTVLAAVRPLAERSPNSVVQQFGTGGYSGVGSLVYALVRCGLSLSEAELIEEAERLAARIDVRLAHEDGQQDVVGGMAGWVLALLALHRAQPRSLALEWANEAGNLLCRRLEHPAAVRRGQPRRRSFGFAHGLAGIGFALWRLAEETHFSKHREMAERAAQLEIEARMAIGLSSAEQDNRPADLSDFLGSWCYGATGVGLAAAAGYAPLVAGSVHSAVETVRSLPMSPSDHLCCGNAGRMDLLMEASGAGAAAATLARRVSARRAREGTWALVPKRIRGVNDYSLLRGMAGIGYNLLRLARPGRIPSVLLLD